MPELQKIETAYGPVEILDTDALEAEGLALDGEDDAETLRDLEEDGVIRIPPETLQKMSAGQTQPVVGEAPTGTTGSAIPDDFNKASARKLYEKDLLKRFPNDVAMFNKLKSADMFDYIYAQAGHPEGEWMKGENVGAAAAQLEAYLGTLTDEWLEEQVAKAPSEPPLAPRSAFGEYPRNVFDDFIRQNWGMEGLQGEEKLGTTGIYNSLRREYQSNVPIDPVTGSTGVSFQEFLEGYDWKGLKEAKYPADPDKVKLPAYARQLDPVEQLIANQTRGLPLEARTDAANAIRNALFGIRDKSGNVIAEGAWNTYLNQNPDIAAMEMGDPESFLQAMYGFIGATANATPESVELGVPTIDYRGIATEAWRNELETNDDFKEMADYLTQISSAMPIKRIYTSPLDPLGGVFEVEDTEAGDPLRLIAMAMGELEAEGNATPGMDDVLNRAKGIADKYNERNLAQVPDWLLPATTGQGKNIYPGLRGMGDKEAPVTPVAPMPRTTGMLPGRDYPTDREGLEAVGYTFDAATGVMKPPASGFAFDKKTQTWGPKSMTTPLDEANKLFGQYVSKQFTPEQASGISRWFGGIYKDYEGTAKGMDVGKEMPFQEYLERQGRPFFEGFLPPPTEGQQKAKKRYMPVVVR